MSFRQFGGLNLISPFDKRFLDEGGLEMKATSQKCDLAIWKLAPSDSGIWQCLLSRPEPMVTSNGELKFSIEYQQTEVTVDVNRPPKISIDVENVLNMQVILLHSLSSHPSIFLFIFPHLSLRYFSFVPLVPVLFTLFSFIALLLSCFPLSITLRYCTLPLLFSSAQTSFSLSFLLLSTF